MQSRELRKRFLAFFAARGHTVVPSDTLVVRGDPTVLFTSAGMSQFKEYFLGRRTDLQRAASCQKCLRTGDLERVGKTPSHHSFFEMLGNFSFGDYFKTEAIAWAWEFLTGTLDYAGRPSPDGQALCLALPAAKLWVSVYEEDGEARDLWRRLGVPDHRIRRLGPGENFWPANAPTEGPNGPCGPCSEIYFDPDGAVQGPGSVEVWNLVFTQSDRQSDGSLTALPKPNIDTGMGLERLARVIQSVGTDYETDLFSGLVEAIARSLHLEQIRDPKERQSLYTASDHVRAAAFLVAERMLPSNEERGYVLRMLIRRAHWHGGQLLWNRGERPPFRPFLAEAMPVLAESMGESYPELIERQPSIREVIQAEEERFAQTLRSGHERILEECQRLEARGERTLSGEFAFMLKDTFGFPFELLRDVVGLSYPVCEVDAPRYAALLAEQQLRSRSKSQFSETIFVSDALRVREALPAVPAKEAQFVGYDHLKADAVIVGLWDGGRWAAQAIEGQTVAVVLDRSPCYGESGGQVGDTGRLDGVHGWAQISQTAWADDVLLHQASVRQGSLGVQDPVRVTVDGERRLKIARSHTATHLLHWALRKVVGPDAVQAGSLVEAERLRFDVSSRQGLREEQRREVEALVNGRVRLVDPVRASPMRLDEARRLGASALFGEKYGEVVRVVTIGEYSKELCGGTHVAHTGFVGAFMVVGESSIAAGTRRIEALVGEAATERQYRHGRLLEEVARRLGRPAEEVIAGLEELLDQVRRADHERKALREEIAQVEAKRLVAAAKEIDGVTLVTAVVKRADREVLAALVDAVRAVLGREGVVLLASSEGPEHASLVMATTRQLRRPIHAGQLLKAVTPLIKGSGGGRADFAQAGGKDPSGIPNALQRAEELIREAIER